MSLTAGTRLGPYEILGLIGAGGMGEVYRGRDTRLDRTVALKILTHGADAPADARDRLVREARAIAALSHPHICTLHDVGSEKGIDFIVEEYLEGETLAQRLRRGPLAVAEALNYAVEIADALAAAHRAGLTHGDVKPGNIMVVASGTKLLDFGLARAFRRPGTGETTVAASLHATIAGTPAYMAPELWAGAPASAPSDVWAIGVVIVEMMLGEHPFSDSGVGTITPFAPEQPRPLPKGTPASLSRIVTRALSRDPLQRYESAATMLDDLQACRRELEAASAPSLWRQTLDGLRRPRVAVAGALIGVALAAAAGMAVSRWSRLGAEAHAARARIPELARLVETERLTDAFRLASEIDRVIPDDPSLAAAWRAISVTGRLDSRPAGALVEVKPYRDTTGPWITLGRTPLENVRLPAGRLRVRAEKDGYEPVIVGRTGLMLIPAGQTPRPNPSGQAEDAQESIPPGLDLQPLDPATGRMVFLPPQPHYAPPVFFGFPDVPAIDLPASWMDEYEVTNREYRAFLTAGGYAHPEYWVHPFVRDGRTLSWPEAMATFVDATGRPGPASWQLGEHPEGQDDWPVTGVSWFEAAAYAAWAGKALPTAHDWIRTAVTPWASDMLPLSNVAGGDRRAGGTVPVGSLPAVSVWGAFDMAGNVKEWCANASTTGRRIVLGGAWDEADYMFYARDERDPFDRPSNVGFRCARYPDGPSAQALSWTPGPQRSYQVIKAVDDPTFEIYRQMYAYDRAPLEDRVEETVDNEAQGWRREKVTYVSPAGGERIAAYVFVPARAAPPYQALVFFPGSAAAMVGSQSGRPGPNVAFVLKSGRLVIYPVYKGTFERATPDTLRIMRSATSVAYRDLQIDLVREVSRAIDYLEARPDVDHDRIGYYGMSMGAAIAPLPLALEPRFRTAILAYGGLFWFEMRPEADPANFLPRVKLPVLMLNGQYDSFFPPLSRETFYGLLGSPAAEKKSIEVPGAGHVAPRSSTIKETLAWLDRYLGAVRVR